ncbi:MAG: molybdopterin-dependent oxidoreductase [Candidatus Odinarchaeota archaeon]
MMGGNFLRTVCSRDCYDTCFLRVEITDKGHIKSVRADPVNPYTRNYTCRRAANDSKRVKTNRVLYPHIRNRDTENSYLEKTNWNEALSLVTEKLQQTLIEQGSESVLHIEYAGNTGLLTANFPLRFWNALGTTKTDYSICSKSGHEALALHYGMGYGIQPEELVDKKFTVYWGFNASVSSPHMWNLSQKARKQHGAIVTVIDPRRSESVKRSDIWVSPRPGSDVALVYGIIRSIIDQGYADQEFIERWTHGYGVLENEAKKWTSSRVEKTTGVKWNQVEELARFYGEFRPSATMIGIGLQKSLQGAEAVRAISLIPAILGLHRGFFYSNKTKFLVDSSYLTGENLVDKQVKVVSQVALSKFVEQGDFKFIYIYGMNPALTLPGQESFRRGLLRDDVFVVVHETHWTETTEFADVVLPAPTYLEKDDLMIPWSHHYVRISKKLINPLGESRDEIWLMRELAKRTGMKKKWLYEDPWEAVREALKKALKNGTFEELLAGKTLELSCRPLDKYQTPTGKIEFLSTGAKRSGMDPLPVQYPIGTKNGEFILLSSALPQYTHTQFQEVIGPIPAIVKMNPADAGLLAIGDGEEISLYNKQGNIIVQAEISTTVPVGVLWSPRLLKGLNGKPQNGLTSCRTQKIGSGPVFNSTIVRITKHLDTVKKAY